MPTCNLAGIRAVAITIAAAVGGIVLSAPAVAQVRTTLSFFSASDLRQGQIGAMGTLYDPDAGEVVAVSRACCFAVTAASAGGAPYQLNRTFNALDSVDQIYYMGVSTVLGEDHLVIALNKTFSSSLVGQEFGSIFAGFSESSLMSSLFDQFDSSLPIDQRIAAGTYLGEFQEKVFELNAGFGLKGSFALTSFSRGTPAGTGFARLFGAAVPEPETWALAILGFGAIGLALRRSQPRLKRHNA